MKTLIYSIFLISSLFSTNFCNAKRLHQNLNLEDKMQMTYFPKSGMLCSVLSISQTIIDNHVYYNAHLSINNSKFQIEIQRTFFYNTTNKLIVKYETKITAENHILANLTKENHPTIFDLCEHIFLNWVNKIEQE